MIKVTSEKGHVELEYDGKTSHILMADFGRIVNEFCKALQDDGIDDAPNRIKHITKVALAKL